MTLLRGFCPDCGGPLWRKLTDKNSAGYVDHRMMMTGCRICWLLCPEADERPRRRIMEEHEVPTEPEVAAPGALGRRDRPPTEQQRPQLR